MERRNRRKVVLKWICRILKINKESGIAICNATDYKTKESYVTTISLENIPIKKPTKWSSFTYTIYQVSDDEYVSEFKRKNKKHISPEEAKKLWDEIGAELN